MDSLIERTRLNAIAFYEGKISIIRFKEGAEDSPSYKVFGVKMKRFEIVTTPGTDRGFAFCAQDFEETDAAVFLLIGCLAAA